MNKKEFRITMFETKIQYKDRGTIKDGCALRAESYSYKTMAKFDTFKQALIAIRTDDRYLPYCERIRNIFIVKEYYIDECYVDGDGDWLDTVDYTPAYTYYFDNKNETIKITNY